MKLFSSLRSQLALYFIPLSLLPLLGMGWYGSTLFHDHENQVMTQMAQAEGDALLSSIETHEAGLVLQTQKKSQDEKLIQAIRRKDIAAIALAFNTYSEKTVVRVYDQNGQLLWAKNANAINSPPLTPSEKETLTRQNELLTRSTSLPVKNFFTVNMVPIRDPKLGLVGFLSESYLFANLNLGALKLRRQAEVILTNLKGQPFWTTFSVGDENIANLIEPSKKADSLEVEVVSLGKERYAKFERMIPVREGSPEPWAKLFVFPSMSLADGMLSEIQTTLTTVGAGVILLVVLLVMFFSSVVLRPIAFLIAGMEQAKGGKLSQIEESSGTDEINYLIGSFNEMNQEVHRSKKALEDKIHQLHEANLEITEAQDQLVQSAKLASLGQLVAGVAHELNNPVGYIFSNLHHMEGYVDNLKKSIEVLLQSVEDLDAEKKEQLLSRLGQEDLFFILKDISSLVVSCKEGSERIKDIVAGLRSFSRIDESPFKLQSIEPGIESSLKILASEFKEGVTLHRDIQPTPPIECNLNQVSQVVLNILSNAAQSIVGKGDIWLRTWSEGAHVFVQIEDSGHGMDAATVDNIFNPFFTTKSVGSGVGLGLSIAYGLIQKHHGEIRVESKKGVGTCFTLVLPVHQPKSVAELA